MLGVHNVIRWQSCLPNCGQKCSLVRWLNFNKKMFHTKEKEDFRRKIVLLSDTKEKVLNAGSNLTILHEVVAKKSNRGGLLLLLPPTFCHYWLLKTQGISCAWRNDLRKNCLIWINNLHSVKEGGIIPLSSVTLSISQIMLFSIFHYLLCAWLYEGVGTECPSLHWQSYLFYISMNCPFSFWSFYIKLDPHIVFTFH